MNSLIKQVVPFVAIGAQLFVISRVENFRLQVRIIMRVGLEKTILIDVYYTDLYKYYLILSEIQKES